MADAVEEIKSRLSIEDVVSEYVQLKRSGRNFKGLSPFTNERTPSFMVSPEKQIWHDFSSGKGGDIFSFVQEVEGLDFKGSLELLARKAGIDLDDYRPKSSDGAVKQSKERLYGAVDNAVKFYQAQLMKHEQALKYLREKRAYEKQTIIDFRFGYSPADGKALLNYLIKKGYSIDELRKTGLVSSRGGDTYDMFRGRIMIPLTDAQGRPVGFTARQLKEDKQSPKYINTPSTLLYDKSRQLFGLHNAKEAIRKSGFVVIVEGNLDVVASHQVGVGQVVAAAGTALTAHQLKSLQRFTGDVRLSFDKDRAGQEAAERAISVAQGLGIELSMINLPSGKDPDELIKQDPNAWIKAIETHQYMVDWLMDRIADSLDLTSAQGKRLFIARILDIVRILKDPVEQEHYVRELAKRTNTSFQTIMEKLQGLSSTRTPLKRIKSTLNEDMSVREQRIREQHLLAMGMRSKKISQLLTQVPLAVFSEDAQETAAYMQAHPGVSPTSSEYVKMLTLLFEEQYQLTSEEELAYQAKKLLSRLVQAYAKLQKQTLISELAEADEKKQATLLTAVKHLDDLVAQFAS